jgi:hypothetical protein
MFHDISMQLGTIWSSSLCICFWQHRCTRLVFWSVQFCPNNTFKNLVFRQRFPGLVPLLQWRLPGLLLLQRLLYLLHLFLRGRLPALPLLLLERLLFRLLLILMLQQLLRRSLPELLRQLSTLLLLDRLLFSLLIILKLQLLLRRSLLGLLLRLLSTLLLCSFANLLLLLLLSLLLLTLSYSTSIWCCTPATCCGFRVGMSRHGWYKDPVLWPLDPLNESPN